ncbi:MAG TPA: hypothetical protein VKD45_13480, partial [Hyphomicrobiaceae bacterium]|nr:hypothetical protein [Hyphomicrobiaceae bacterium]
MRWRLVVAPPSMDAQRRPPGLSSPSLGAALLSARPPDLPFSAPALRWRVFLAEQRKFSADLCLQATLGGTVGDQR